MNICWKAQLICHMCYYVNKNTCNEQYYYLYLDLFQWKDSHETLKYYFESMLFWKKKLLSWNNSYYLRHFFVILRAFIHTKKNTTLLTMWKLSWSQQGEDGFTFILLWRIIEPDILCQESAHLSKYTKPEC